MKSKYLKLKELENTYFYNRIQLDKNCTSLSDLKESFRLDKLTLFTSELKIQIFSEVLPHNYNEAYLDVNIVASSISQEIKDGEIIYLNNVNIWEWKPKGIFPDRNLIQIEFLFNKKLNISIGFWEISFENKYNFLATGEIALNKGKILMPEAICSKFPNMRLIKI